MSTDTTPDTDVLESLVRTVNRGAKTVRTLEPPLKTYADASAEAKRYRRPGFSADWEALGRVAVSEFKKSQRARTQMVTSQSKLNSVDAAATALATSSADLGPHRLNELTTWRTIAKGIREDAMARGVSESFARRTVTRLGHEKAAFRPLAEHVQGDRAGKVVTFNQAHHHNVRSYAGALTAMCVAAMNSGDVGRLPTGARRTSHATFEQLERSVYTSVVNGESGVPESLQLQAVAEDSLRTACERLAEARAGTLASFRATSLVKRTIEAAVIGAMLSWRLGWTNVRDKAWVAEAAGLPFASQDPVELLAPAAPHERPLVSGRVTDVSYVRRRSLVTVQERGGTRREVEVRGTDVAALGCIPGCFAEVYHGRDAGAGRLLASFAAHTEPGGSWQSTVRYRMRSSFLGDPFALGIRWSWAPGDDGAVRLCALTAWFS